MRKFLHTNLLKGLFAVLALVSFSNSWGQLSITTPNSAVTQNFDTLPSTGTGLAQSGGIFANGWSFLEGAANADGLYITGTGGGNAGNTYSFGVAGVNPLSDRALGMLQSGNLTSILGFKFTNNTGATVTSITIGYTGETWRLSAAADSFAFSYQSGNVALNAASGWTTVGGLAFTTPTIGTAAAVDGNSATRRVVVTPVTITGLTIANGTTFTLRWVDPTASSSAGIAIDDFSITLIPAAPTQPTVTTTAATAIGNAGATLNGTINPNGLTIDAIFEYGTDLLYGNQVNSTTGLTGTSEIPVSGVIAPGMLVPNTLYNFRLVGVGGDSPENGDNLTFYTLANVPNAPGVGNATTNSLDVTIHSTTENGNPSGTLYAIRETGSGNYVHADGTLGAIEWVTVGTIAVTGLSDNTSYTFEVKAKNGVNVETAFGTSASGTTLENLNATLTLDDPLADFGDVCTGEDGKLSFSFDGENLNGSDIVVGALDGFTYSLSEFGTFTSTLNIPAGATVTDQVVWVTFSPTLVQSYDGNIPLTGGGLAATFNVVATASGVDTAVDVTTGSAASVTSVSAVLAGSFIEGCSSVSDYGIEYSTANGFVTGTQQLAGSNVSGAFDVSLTGLEPNTAYYYKAFATDGTGTVYGLQSNFTTNGLAAPNATAASPITSDSFNANWEAVDGATSYALDVKTDPFLPAPVIKPWINEVHYEDVGTDGNEFIEIVVPDAYTGTGLTLTLYNGAGGASYTTIALGAMTLGQDTPTYNVYSITTGVDGIQNGAPDGFALSDSNGLIQFLSYEGAFTATNGPANGQTSVNIGVSESTATPDDSSLHLTGTGSAYNDFTWAVSLNVNSKGSNNAGQTINATAAGTYIIENLNVGNVLTHLVSGLTENTTYYYRVRAVSANSTSPNSNMITATTAHAPATFGDIAQVVAVVCDGANATFDVNGLYPGITSELTYNINGGADQTVEVAANLSGFGTFEIPLVLANNGQVLTVTSVDRTDFPGNPVAVTTNNTVVLSVSAYETYYLDADGDGFGDPTMTTQACDGVPSGYTTNNTDCDDDNNAANTFYPYFDDADGDGYGSDTVVNICAANPLVAPTGFSTNSDDCNDNNASIPGTEIGYNLIDDDCDGSIDEGFPPKVTVIQGAMCNVTLAAIDSQLIANLVAGAQGYRWRITTMSGPNVGQVQTLDTAIRSMKLTSLTSYAFNTQYKVEVGVYYAGFLQPYQPSNCTVTTPSVTSVLAVCGQTLTNISDKIYANLVSFAAGYRFRITDPLTPTNTQEIERPIRDFRLNMVTAFVVQYGKTYNIEVAVKNTDGTYMGYGGVCSVTTPVFPTTSLQDSQCDDYAVPTNATTVYAYSYPGAIAYVFQVTGPGLGSPLEVTRPTRTFTLNDFPSLAGGTTYNVRVRLVFNVSDPAGPFGKICTIVTPGASRQVQAKAGFDAVAYPNPFANNFNIDMTSAQSQDITVKVYDMTGRLLDNVTVKSTHLETLEIGDLYPSGVYNVIVNQGEEAKILRVVKR